MGSDSIDLTGSGSVMTRADGEALAASLLTHGSPSGG